MMKMYGGDDNERFLHIQLKNANFTPHGTYTANGQALPTVLKMYEGRSESDTDRIANYWNDLEGRFR